MATPSERPAPATTPPTRRRVAGASAPPSCADTDADRPRSDGRRAAARLADVLDTSDPDVGDARTQFALEEALDALTRALRARSAR
ncbi:hypothetical protein [Agilicoccus flavus]|uniref:hypothetical protein n=1 Tax=Agilicoccus flavus TaxID=2775968 RepID=UPI001CF6A71A|nr:hypothetical protein [Agilicoccus flavus]